MAIKRYTANADTTITNAFGSNLKTRGTGSNMGLSDSLEVFSIYGQENTGSTELSRILVKFPTTEMSTDRTNGDLPASGSVKFYLRMFNAKHPSTLPKNFVLQAMASEQDWEEGYGMDMEEYSDLTYDEDGANWENASSGTKWNRIGGDFYETGSVYKTSFPKGHEDLEIDISELVEDWIDGRKSNYGIGLMLTGTQEAYFSSSVIAGNNGVNQPSSGTVPHNLTGSTRS